MDNRFAGTVALVTGASRGIGLAVASRLVAEGARVCLTARTPEPLAAAVARLGDAAIGVPGRADDPVHQRDAVARVNVASVAGLRPAPGLGGYAASKAALIQLTAQLAMELAPKVRVNAVAPAVVKTSFAGALYEGREDRVAAGYPLGRLGVPEDVAAAAAGWITGQTLVLDGGLTLTGGVR